MGLFEIIQELTGMFWGEKKANREKKKQKKKNHQESLVQ
jgi:hypothetical protein